MVLHSKTRRLRHARRARRNAGFTLLELMLVMGLLVIIAALAYPAVSGPLENNRLRHSGELIRGAWARARTKAMESGRTYVFRCQPEADGYVVEPWINNDDLLESDLVTQSGVAVGESIQEVSAIQLGPQIQKLPEDVTFLGSEVVGDTRSQFLAVTADSATESEAGWTTPIFFYPDGSSSTARLILQNKRERYVLLTLRGLTGVVTSRGLLTADELPR